MFFTSKEEQIIIQFLSNSPFFSGVSTRSLKALVKQLLPTPFKSGEYVMKQGDSDDCLYLVMHGRLRLSEKHNDKIVELGEIGPGEFIGEIALLTSSPRLYSVFTIRDSVLLKLNKEDFIYFTKHHHEQLLKIVRQTLIRLKNKDYINNRVHTFCLVPAGDSKDLRAFSNAFINALDGNFLYLTQHNIKKHLKHAGIEIKGSHEYDKISQWLSEQENNYRFVIYESGPELNEWSRLCIRQADKLLLIANYSANTELNPLEDYLFEHTHCNKDLVILQSPKLKLPQRANHWLYDRPVQSHHHVALDSPASLKRLLRYLTNQTIAVVLGGGGARGFAHIGVYKALMEHNIPIDCIGGTSSGSVMAALLAMNLSLDEIIELTRRNVAENKQLFKYTLPIHSVISGRRLSEMFMELLGTETLAENLWRRFFCVATSLSTLESKLLTHGLLWKNIRASISIPGIFPPISTVNQELLIDGAITNNLPVDIMEDFSNQGFVISVNVSGKPKITSDAVPNGWISPWHSLKENFSNKRLPTIPEIMMESAMICSAQHQRQMYQRADLNINCFTENFPVLNFKPLDKLIELGYQAAIEALKQQRSKLPLVS